jgi:ABC-type multidrug transport system fused ATPase/permease subunit
MSETEIQMKENPLPVKEAQMDNDAPETVNSDSMLGEKTKRMMEQAAIEGLPDVGDDMGSVIEHDFDEHEPFEKTEFDPPNVKVTLTWEDVMIKADMTQKKCCGRKPKVGNVVEKKDILNNISGIIKPGQFVSIIGASGAGKTTLLNYLSGKISAKNLEITGEVKVNGMLSSKIKNYGIFSAFVQQDDVLYQTMTVRECIDFSAKLRF